MELNNEGIEEGCDMLRILVTRGGVVESIRDVDHLVVFVEDEAGHPKPVVEVNKEGKMCGPIKAKDRRFYELLDEQEEGETDKEV